MSGLVLKSENATVALRGKSMFTPVVHSLCKDCDRGRVYE